MELNCNHFPMEKYFPCLDVEHCLRHSEQVVLLWEFKFLLEGRAQKYLFLFTVTSHYSSYHYHNFMAPFPCQESLEGFFGEGKSSTWQWLPYLKVFIWGQFREETALGTSRWIPRSWGLVGAVSSFSTELPQAILESLFEEKSSPVPSGCCSSALPSRYACLILKQLYSCTATMPAHPSPMKLPRMIHSKLNHIYFQFIITLTTGNSENFIFWVQQQATGCKPLVTVHAWERCLSLFFIPLPVLPP